jgi:hypothetical protein
MQYKKSQKELKKQIRHMHERMAAMVVLVATAAGVYTVSHEARRVISGLALHPTFAVVEHSSKQTEPARHPVRLDEVLRNPAISGQ